MLNQEMNEFLTRTGPRTPMGELLRRYWIPALLDSELPEPDCAPVRVKLLGEKLVAFRDSDGRLGLIGEFCAHRGVSLWFGRNEECGLRCPYHGWKYDVTGQCVDLPSEAEETGMRLRVRLKSYPCMELAGVIWTYMGPPELKPAPPARGTSHRPARVGADGRRALLGVVDQLSPGARADRARAAGDDGRQGHTRELRARHVRAPRQQGERLPHGPRDAEVRRQLQRD